MLSLLQSSRRECLTKFGWTTENKSLKGSGGIIGLTVKDSALSRWFLARPITAQYSNVFHREFGKGSRKKRKETLGQSAIKRWNDDVMKMIHMFEEAFIDPFNLNTPPIGLVNIATGTIATKEIEESFVYP